jgi:N-acetylglucosaminyldiphosphoundecaprenol N-acetyl-beta-D-mannosaminyltransferase
VSSNRHWLLGVPVDDATESDVLRVVRDRVRARQCTQIATVNAEFVVKAQHDEEFREVLRTVEIATADGAGVLWALRRAGVRILRRVGGSDLIWSISAQAAELGHRVFLLGAAPGVAAAAAEKLRARYPALQVAGTYVGSPDEGEQATIVDLIRRSEADIVFVAFGAPSQDVWIARNLKETGASIGMGVGGSFDYVAGVARRAPLWMQDAGLDWLWRLVRQPWRWRRMLSLPRFVWLVLRASSSPEKGPLT